MKSLIDPTKLLEFLSEHIRNLKKISSTEVRGLCPWHDDKEPSLCVSLETSEFYCHGCHARGNLRTLCKKLQVPIPSVPSNNSAQFGTPIETYDYKDPDGKVLYQIVRFEPKSFKQKRPDGTWGRGGTKEVLYNLPELTKEESLVCITEGEKDANNLVLLGFTATTNSSGAGKWKDEYRKYFKKDQAVIIFQDNDSAGRADSNQKAISLYHHVDSIRIIKLPTISHGQDISDWLELNGFVPDADEHKKTSIRRSLLDIISKTPEFRPPREIVSANTLLNSEIQRPQFFVENLVFKQGATILAGPPKAGKSIFTLDMALKIVRGLPILSFKSVPCRILLCLQEDPIWLVKERMSRLLGTIQLTEPQLDSIGLLIQASGLHLDTNEGFDNFVQKLSAFKPDIVVLDTLVRFHSQPENEQLPMANLFEKFDLIREEFNTALFIIHHTRKEGRMPTANPIELIRGSSVMTGWAESVLVTKNFRGLKQMFISSKFSADRTINWNLVSTERNTLSIDYLGESVEETQEDKKQEMLQIVDSLFQEGGEYACLVDNIAKRMAIHPNTVLSYAHSLKDANQIAIRKIKLYGTGRARMVICPLYH